MPDEGQRHLSELHGSSGSEIHGSSGSEKHSWYVVRVVTRECCIYTPPPRPLMAVILNFRLMSLIPLCTRPVLYAHNLAIGILHKPNLGHHVLKSQANPAVHLKISEVSIIPKLTASQITYIISSF
jgi:hypothetical protein